MAARQRQIEIYTKTDGSKPYIDWLFSLKSKETREVIAGRVDRTRLGNMGLARAVGDGVLELKIDFGPGYRIYFAEYDRTVVLLLCGGDKSTQDKDIKNAKKYWADHKQKKKR